MPIWLYSPWAYKNISTVSSLIFFQECLSTILGINHMLRIMATILACGLPMLWIISQHPQCPPFLFLIHGNCFVLCCHRALVLSALTALTLGLHPATFGLFSRSYLSCSSSGNPSLNPTRPHRLGQALLLYIQSIPWQTFTYSLSNHKKVIIFLIILYPLFLWDTAS